MSGYIALAIALCNIVFAFLSHYWSRQATKALAEIRKLRGEPTQCDWPQCGHTLDQGMCPRARR